MYVLLALAIIVVIIWLVLTTMAFIEDGIFEGIISIIFGAAIVFLIDSMILLPVLVLDKSSGTTLGVITSVDKNFFGSTAIYVKTSETEQEEYCAEDNEIIEKAKENIGNKVKVSYGTRVGFYKLKQCNQAPIDKIEVIGEKLDE